METTSSMASEDVDAAEGSLVDDEEFVAEEHAHRCVPCRSTRHGCRPLLWIVEENRMRVSWQTQRAGADGPKSCAELPAVYPTELCATISLFAPAEQASAPPIWHLHPANMALVPQSLMCPAGWSISACASNLICLP